MKWYYADGDRQMGPIEEEEFLSLVESGRVKPETLVWRDGLSDWKPFASVGIVPSMTRPADGEDSGFQLPPMELEGGPHGGMVYGGFWLRFVAALLDGVILGIVALVLMTVLALVLSGIDSAVAEGMISMVQLVFGAAYVTFFLGKYGATPGKMALGLKVVRSDGSELTYARAFGRYLAEYLSAFTLMIGYIIAAFDREKRALHDHICDTRVIRD